LILIRQPSRARAFAEPAPFATQASAHGIAIDYLQGFADGSCMEWTTLQADDLPDVVALVLALKVGKRIRLVLPHVGRLHQLLFLEVRPDGSVLCGTGDKAGRMTQTARRRNSDQPLPSKLEASVPEAPIPPGFHFSFHTSGVISATGTARTYRGPLSTPGPRTLCIIRFRLPGLLRLVEQDPRDLEIPLVCDPNRALEAQLTIVDSDTPVIIADRGEQIALIFQVHDATGQRAYSVQLTFYRRDVPWTDATTITWVSQDPERHGFRG